MELVCFQRKRACTEGLWWSSLRLGHRRNESSFCKKELQDSLKLPQHGGLKIQAQILKTERTFVFITRRTKRKRSRKSRF